jgi:hypothetical protein
MLWDQGFGLQESILDREIPHWYSFSEQAEHPRFSKPTSFTPSRISAVSYVGFSPERIRVPS